MLVVHLYGGNFLPFRYIKLSNRGFVLWLACFYVRMGKTWDNILFVVWLIFPEGFWNYFLYVVFLGDVIGRNRGGGMSKLSVLLWRARIFRLWPMMLLWRFYRILRKHGIFLNVLFEFAQSSCEVVKKFSYSKSL